MSYSLQVKNGDLVAQAGQLSIVAGAQKLLQDLSLWVLTRMGSDQYNLGYGSLIDGGTQPDGTIIDSPIGTTQWSATQALIQQDITRIITTYQAQQNARMQSDTAIYNKQTLTNDEILTGVTNIAFQVSADQLIVVISVTNASNRQLTFSVPVQGTVI